MKGWERELKGWNRQEGKDNGKSELLLCYENVGFFDPIIFFGIREDGLIEEKIFRCMYFV